MSNRQNGIERPGMSNTYKIVFIGVMSAVVFLITYLRVPLGASKLHFANAFCVLSGLLFGPAIGGLSSGIGSFLYDVVTGYDIAGSLITFVSKLAMGLVAGLIAHSGGSRGDSKVKNLVGSVAGALLYIALYMLRTYIYQRFVYGFPPDVTGVALLSRLPASLLNGGAAIIIAPLLATALRPTLKYTRLYK